MKTVKVNLKKNSYAILIGSNILPRAGAFIRRLNIGDYAYIITNAAIKNRYGAALDKTLRISGVNSKFKLIPDSEKSKSLNTAFSLIRDVAACEKKRQLFIVAFGGGVVGDLTGFVASIYKRGLPYVQIATTLLAQVDSAIGGKTGVNLAQGKNLAGAFYQPKLVLSDIATLKSLDLKQLRNGLAEVIKYAVINDAALLNYLEKKYKDILAMDEKALEFIVARCSHIKAEIVALDEKEEKGIRTILNFGHTIGHAIEVAAGYKGYSHGEAVALGMLVACGLSEITGLASGDTGVRIENLIKKAGLPVKINRVSIADIINAYYFDKKFIGAKNRFVLIEGIGKTKIVQDIPLSAIKKAISNRMGRNPS